MACQHCNLSIYIIFIGINSHILIICIIHTLDSRINTHVSLCIRSTKYIYKNELNKSLFYKNKLFHLN